VKITSEFKQQCQGLITFCNFVKITSEFKQQCQGLIAFWNFVKITSEFKQQCQGLITFWNFVKITSEFKQQCQGLITFWNFRKNRLFVHSQFDSEIIHFLVGVVSLTMDKMVSIVLVVQRQGEKFKYNFHTICRYLNLVNKNKRIIS
jgi:hypothetical protein